MASIKVEFECCDCRCGCYSDDENSECWEEDKIFQAWYVFDIPGISGTVGMYELGDAPWLLQDYGIIPQGANVGDKFTITLWEGTDEDVENRDHKLERMGWMKFHDREISFVGYSGIRATAKVTNRQKDRLVEYCKAKKYDDLYAPFLKIYSMSDDEWRDIFEW